MSTILGLVAVVLLILANGYFVAAEFAYVAVDRNSVERAAESGDGTAHRVLAVLRRLSFMLSGAQLGITVTSLVVGFIAAGVFRDALEPLLEAAGLPERSRGGVAVTAGFVIATAGQMLVGELAPKNLAIARPEPVARRLARSLRVFLRLSGPVIAFFDNSSNRVLRAVGIEPVEELSHTASLDELDIIVEESGSEGALEPSQAMLLNRALAFPELTASEVATPAPRVVTAAAGATCADLRDLMATGHSRYPVSADGEILGVVHVRELLGVPRDEWATTPVTALMAEPVIVPETARLPQVLRTLRSNGSELAVVFDEHGTFVGVLTAEDLAEELVGDIRDETDRLRPGVQQLSALRWTLPGSLRIDEVLRETGVHLPEGDYETVAGLILTELGHIPVRGETVDLADVRLVVREVERRAIASVALEVLVAGDDATAEGSEP
ncbi:MAG TPA: hemolysin family protein [Acidimicrobiia bacterium]|nr:hemolysin family protein [Acidimicrobiia bacterium]